MKHAVLIMAHGNIHYLLKMIHYFDSDFDIYIHLDRKKRFNRHEILQLENKPNVIIIAQQYTTNWGGFNILKAELLLIELAFEKGKYDYFHLISGQDYPTRNMDEFKRFFRERRGKEFIEYSLLPKKKWENGTFERFHFFRLYDFFDYKTPKGYKIINKIIQIQKKWKLMRKLPNQFEPLYGGSAWFSITSYAAEYILEYTKKHRSFYKKLQFTFAPEETYIPTILLHSPLKNNIENCNLRYIDWRFRNNSFPAILDEHDFDKIMDSTAFFARKIDPYISEALIKKIDKKIGNVE